MKTKISILLGLVMSLIFYFFNSNKIYKGPDSNQIKKMTFQDKNGICYKFKVIPYVC